MALTSPRSERRVRAPATATWKDFVALPDDDRRELIDGVLMETELPNALHEHIVALLAYFLGSWIRPRKAGVLLASGYKVRVSARRGVMPDLQFFARNNPSQPMPGGLEAGHPDLVVEIISPSGRRFDRNKKLEWYAAIGVPEYWIVDPEAKQLERLVLHRGKYLIDQVASEDELFKPSSFKGLEIPLAELWALP